MGQPETGELGPGIRRGTLTLQFEDGTPRTVSLSFWSPQPEILPQVCAARKPLCGKCNLESVCYSKDKTLGS